MKKIVALLLAIVMLMGMTCATAFADGAGVMPRNSAYFTSYGTSITPIGGGTLHITFSTVGTDVCSQLGVASYTVEREDDDGNWENCSGLFSGETGSGVASYTFSRYFYGVQGETYRVCVTFISTINNSTESKTYTSGKVTAN